MAALPRFVSFQSKHNAKYLRFISEDVEVRKLLQFSGDEVVTPFTKFEFQTAKDESGLVHIRCCYNNKYLVRRSSSEWWISADADEPEEDRSKWSCTLFEPVVIGDADSDGDGAKTITVRLLHVQLQNYACLWRVPPPYDDCWYAGSNGSETIDLCSVIDWDSLVLLPKHIAFKGDNGYYLSARWIEGYEYLQFSSDSIKDSSVWNQLFITNDGKTRIKSNYYGKYWRRSPNWIWGDSTDTTGKDLDTLFVPVRVDYNTIGLVNLGNNYFCKRLTTEGKTSCLNAGISSFSYEAHLDFEELVSSRKIYSVDFKVADARIFDKQVVTVACGEAINETNEVAENMSVKLEYEDTRTSVWNSTTSMKMMEVEMNLETLIPRIENGVVELGEEFLGSYIWGQPRTTSETKVKEVTVTVPPMSVVEVSLRATMASFDIPFSYIQSDDLISGDNDIDYMDDGICSGGNYYNFELKKEEKPL